jgi:hypothetical protein
VRTQLLHVNLSVFATTPSKGGVCLKGKLTPMKLRRLNEIVNL